MKRFIERLDFRDNHVRRKLLNDLLAPQASHARGQLPVPDEFSQLLRQARVDLACELLLTTNESLATIAGRCGFFDQSHFTKVFTQAKQLTPRHFREANRPRQATAAADEGPVGPLPESAG